MWTRVYCDHAVVYYYNFPIIVCPKDFYSFILQQFVINDIYCNK